MSSNCHNKQKLQKKISFLKVRLTFYPVFSIMYGQKIPRAGYWGFLNQLPPIRCEAIYALAILLWIFFTKFNTALFAFCSHVSSSHLPLFVSF
jgi:hypothetical protein